jgi:DNA-binding transcriptional LysR family regulator
MDRLTSMSVFVKAADLGSFTDAAAALELSGPMVGKHVRFLEKRLGVRLINRTTRRQSLTEFGRVYYDRCLRILAEVEASDALAADQHTEPRGRLRVTMPVHFGRHCVVRVLLQLTLRYPDLELDLSFDDQFVDLAEGEYDLAIRTGSLDERAGLIARRVARQQMIVCASPAYLETHGAPQNIDDITRHKAVMYRRSGPVSPWLFPQGDQTVRELMPAGRVRLGDLDSIADAVTLGNGLAWLPYWLVKERIETGDLVQLLPDQSPYLYDCFAAWLQTPHLPLNVRAAVDELVIQLPKFMS